MIPITAAALGTKTVKNIGKILGATKENGINTNNVVKPIESKPVDNSNLESRVSALEGMVNSGSFNMNMGSKQINTPTNFSSRDLEALYSAKLFM
jgi:hypothetical protein